MRGQKYSRRLPVYKQKQLITVRRAKVIFWAASLIHTQSESERLITTYLNAALHLILQLWVLIQAPTIEKTSVAPVVSWVLRGLKSYRACCPTPCPACPTGVYSTCREHTQCTMDCSSKHVAVLETCTWKCNIQYVKADHSTFLWFILMAFIWWAAIQASILNTQLHNKNYIIEIVPTLESH